MLASILAAEVFGQKLLAEQPTAVAVEIHSNEERVTTIKKLGAGQTASTPIHRLRVSNYRLTLVDKNNQAEAPRVVYLEADTRRVAERRAQMATAVTETIVDLVPLD